MNKGFFFIAICLCFFVSFSCSSKKDEVPETTTSGELNVFVDEGFWPILIQEKTVFEYQYKYASLHYVKMGQEEAIHSFLLDSAKFIVTSRKLSEQELTYLKSKDVYPKTYLFAQDGLVVLSNKESSDTSFTFSELNEISSGKRTDHLLVFDRSTNASLYTFVDLLHLKKTNLAGVFSADSVPGVIDFVLKNKHALGVVGSSWFSEQDSKKVKVWMEKLKISTISRDGKDFYQPFQSEIADSLYPLSRPIYVIVRESKMNLATGYSSFLLGEKGQRIVLKSGLLPAIIPSREVVISKKTF